MKKIILSVVIFICLLLSAYYFGVFLPKKEAKIAEQQKQDQVLKENQGQQTERAKQIEANKQIIKEMVGVAGDELYDCNVIGTPIVRDIDGDGITEKVVRCGKFMADRLIEVLYLYRDIDGENKLIKTFEGDPYGFAKMLDDKNIVVGRFIPFNGEPAEGEPLKNWEDFEEFELTKYQWTKKGEILLSRELIPATTAADVEDKIDNNFYSE